MSNVTGEDISQMLDKIYMQEKRIRTLEAENAELRAAGDAMIEVMVDSGTCDYLDPSETCICGGCRSIALWDEAKGKS